VNAVTVRLPRPITARTIQMGLGVVWLLDGLLQLQPKMFGQAFVTGVLDPVARGQPGFVTWPLTHMAHLISLHPAAWNGTFAAVQLLIGVGLLVRETVKPALVLSVVWALAVWGLGEGFGMLFAGMASPLTGAPGAVILYAVIGILVWPRRSRATVVGAAARGERAAAVAEGPLGERGGRVVWAVLWTSMAALWLLPGNRVAEASSSAVAGAASGQPGWLAGPQRALAHTLAGHGTEVAVLLAMASVVIGWGPLLTRRAIPFLVAGAALSLDYWVFGQSLGGVLTGFGTDPNAAPLFILLAVALFPNAASADRTGGYRQAVPDPTLPARPAGADDPDRRTLAPI
jgi:hypothetical protein